MSDPTAEDAARILTAVTNKPVWAIRRFPNGLAHFVYDAQLAGGERLVIRLTRPEQRDEFAGAVYWHPRLVALGIPLPDLLFTEIDDQIYGFPVLIMERLRGVDLGDCYATLKLHQKRSIAMRVVAMQRHTATLPDGSGFGYATKYDDPSLKPNWLDVLTESLDEGRAQIRSAGVISEGPVDRVARAVQGFHDYFLQVQPVCFLHDTTTKNVMVDNGALTGIVDVDSVCFGDPLWVLALTNMAMLSAGFDRDYVDAWAGALDLAAEQRTILALYTAIHCAYFLSEIGQCFNKSVPPPVDPRHVAHLQNVLDDLLVQVGSS